MTRFDIPDRVFKDVKDAWGKLNAPVRRITNNIYRVISEKYKVYSVFIRGRNMIQLNLLLPRSQSMQVSISMHSTRRGQLRYYTISIFQGGFKRSVFTSLKESWLVAIFSSVFMHF